MPTNGMEKAARLSFLNNNSWYLIKDYAFDYTYIWLNFTLKGIRAI